MTTPEWVEMADVVALNVEVVRNTLEDHGLVHPTKLIAAINRPRQHAAYGPEETQDDLVLLGAKLCVGISESQGFIQGNKRTGFAAMEMFFNLNGYVIDGSAHGLVASMILASAHPDKDRRLSEDDFAHYLDPYVVDGAVDLIGGGMLTLGSISQFQVAMGEAMIDPTKFKAIQVLSAGQKYRIYRDDDPRDE